VALDGKITAIECVEEIETNRKFNAEEFCRISHQVGGNKGIDFGFKAQSLADIVPGSLIAE